MHQVKLPAPIQCFLTNRFLSFHVILAQAVFLVFAYPHPTGQSIGLIAGIDYP